MTATNHREQGERTPNPAREDQGDYAGIETSELKVRALAVCTPPAPEPSAKRPGS